MTSTGRRIWFFSIWGIVIALILFMARAVLLPFVLALLLAYVLAPLADALEKWVPRWVGVLGIHLFLIAAAGAFVWLGTPRLFAEIEKLARDGPRAIRVMQHEWVPNIERRLRAAMESYQVEDGPDAFETAESQTTEDASLNRGAPIRIEPDEKGYRVYFSGDIAVRRESPTEFRVGPVELHHKSEKGWVQSLGEAFQRTLHSTEADALTLLRTARTFIVTLVRGFFGFFIVMMLSAYLLITSDQILAFLRSLVRPRQLDDFDRLLRRVDQGLVGVVRGQILISVVNGILSGIGFYWLKLKYWPILTLIATALSVIPIFGVFLSSVPAAVVGLQQSPGTGLLVIAWIVLIHQIEANVLNPKIMGHAAKVHPVLVVFALLAGEHIAGLVGALLAVPCLSILQSLFLHFREVALNASHAHEETSL